MEKVEKSVVLALYVRTEWDEFLVRPCCIDVVEDEARTGERGEAAWQPSPWQESLASSACMVATAIVSRSRFTSK